MKLCASQRYGLKMFHCCDLLGCKELYDIVTNVSIYHIVYRQGQGFNQSLFHTC